MKIVRYPALEGNIKVWKEYNLWIRDSIYGFEVNSPDNKFYAYSTDLNSMIEKLRRFRVNPNQVENHSVLSTPKMELSDGQFERLIRGVSRSKFVVMKLPRMPGDKIKRDEYGLNVDLNRMFALDIDIRGNVETLPLERLPNRLNIYGVMPNDLIFLKSTEYGFGPLKEKDKYKYHILTSLDRVK